MADATFTRLQLYQSVLTILEPDQNDNPNYNALLGNKKREAMAAIMAHCLDQQPQNYDLLGAMRLIGMADELLSNSINLRTPSVVAYCERYKELTGWPSKIERKD